MKNGHVAIPKPEIPRYVLPKQMTPAELDALRESGPPPGRGIQKKQPGEKTPAERLAYQGIPIAIARYIVALEQRIEVLEGRVELVGKP